MSEMSKPKLGVYISRYGQLKVLERTDRFLILDEGRIIRHPNVPVSMAVVSEMSLGWPVYETVLKNHEYLGAL